MTHTCLKKTISIAAIILASTVNLGFCQTNQKTDFFVGEGKHKFQIKESWGMLPKVSGSQSELDTKIERRLGPTHGSTCCDKNGNVYVALDKGEFGLAVFDRNGKFLRFSAKGLAGIHHLILQMEDGAEFLYGAHLAGKTAIKLDLNGKPIWKLGCPMESGKYQKRNQYRPTGITVSNNGSVYVADGYGKNWIHQFDKNQKYVRSIGGLGGEPGKFRTCHSVAIDRRDGTEKLLVCDRENRRLQYFDLEGRFLSVSTTGLKRPCCLSIHKDIVAVAELEGRVSLLDKKNKIVSVLGDNKKGNRRANYSLPPKDWDPKQFNAPHGLCFTSGGDLIVLEWNKVGRLVYLKKQKM